MFLISMMCLSVFAGLQQITKTALNVAIRDEAYHLLQAKAEQLIDGTYANFVPTTTDQTITSSVKTSYAPSKTGALAITADNAVGRVTFTRRVVNVATDAVSTTLRVEVQWTWDKRTSIISSQLLRYASE